MTYWESGGQFTGLSDCPCIENRDGMDDVEGGASLHALLDLVTVDGFDDEITFLDDPGMDDLFYL